MCARSLTTCACSAFLATLALVAGSSMPAPSTALSAPLSCSAGTPGSSSTEAATQSVATVAPIPTQSAIEEEENPPGDIPDDQAFVEYISADGGYGISMPEGWARTEDGPNVTFADKLHTFSITLVCADAAPTVDSVTQNEVPLLQQQKPAFELTDVSEVDRPAGKAILLRYKMNSEPDEVTGKQYRLEVEQFEFFKDGVVVSLALYVPAGSDNVDVSNLVSESFRWTS